MTFRALVDGDPFSTSADRVIAAGFITLGAAYNAASRSTWSEFTPAERAEMLEYWAAVRENDEWNAARDREWGRALSWDQDSGRTIGESDEEWRDRVSRLRWMKIGRRWIFRPDCQGSQPVPKRAKAERVE